MATERSRVTERAIQTFREHYYLPDAGLLEFVWATIIANRYDGDAVWGGIIGPPGDSKTSMLAPYQSDKDFLCLSHLTDKTLISGKDKSECEGGKEPSLLASLDRKMLIVKDLTTLLKMRPEVVAAIFGQLRDAFDGDGAAAYGTGAIKAFRAKFGMLVAVTSEIETMWRNNMLGERFVYYRVAQSRSDMRKKVASALKGAVNKSHRDAALRTAAYGVIAVQEYEPGISGEAESYLSDLAEVVASCRSVVARDSHEKIVYTPENEVGTRLGKQLATLGRAHCVLWRDKEMGSRTLLFLRRVARSTLPSLRVLILDEICARKEPYALKELTVALNLDGRTIRGICDDLTSLGVLQSGVAQNSVNRVYSPAEWLTEVQSRSKIFGSK